MILTIVCLTAALMCLAEILLQGRKWAAVSGWWTRALFLNVAQFGTAWVAGNTWELSLRNLRPVHPWSLESWGLPAQALLGYFAITFVYYWWHRWRHEVGPLWRFLHQVHHSPTRIEIITSFYKHPLEILVNSILSSAILYFLVGVTPEAAAYAILLTGLAELFYHWNVPTPHWLGYFIQRPESHCVHHQRELHSMNFGDLPLWDMLFGTFHNPKEWQAECGFGPGKEQQLWPMLKGQLAVPNLGAAGDDERDTTQAQPKQLGKVQ